MTEELDATVESTPQETPTAVTETVAPDTPFGYMPENWRDDFSMGDEKKAAQLGRYKSTDDFVKSFWEGRDKISKGLSSELPDNATPEQLAEYRQSRGVPESPDQYKLNLGEGMVLGEEDKGIMDAVLKAAHHHNVSPDVMSDLATEFLGTRGEAQQAAEDQRYTQDNLDAQGAQQALRETWGNDYQTNLNIIQNQLEGLPESVRDDFSQARMPDGTALFNSPEFMNWFTDIGRQINPMASIVPNTAAQMSAMNDIIGEADKLMRSDDPSDRAKYQSADFQARYDKALEQQVAYQQRGH